MITCNNEALRLYITTTVAPEPRVPQSLTGPIHPRVQNVLSKPRIKQHTPEWHRVRGTLITATNLASIVGMNPYCSASQLFKHKTGITPVPVVNSIACDHGNKYEEVAARCYSQYTNIEVVEEDIGLVVHSEHPWVAASPDRIAKYRPVLIEIKCPWRRKIQPQVIPKYYMPQIQMQLEVCDIDECHFVQYVPPTDDRWGIMDITVVQRDREWWSKSVLVAQFFYQMVLSYYKEKQAPIGSLIHSKKQEEDKESKDEDETTQTTCLFT